MLEIKNVDKSYGTKKALENISITVDNGSVFGFIGANGAGKTTLIKAIVGIHNIDSGEITLNNKSINDAIAYKKDIAYVPDNPDIYPNLKGIEYLNFICDIYEIGKDERLNLIEKYAKDFEIYNNLEDIISSYSHGMKQKLVLISALIHKPKLLVLDEPFVGLDPKSTKILKDIIKELKSSGVIIFLSSHVLEVVEKICDHIGIIKNGKLIAIGETNKIKGKEDLENIFLELTSEE